MRRARKTKIPEAPGKSLTFMMSYSVVYGHSSCTVCRQGILSMFGISKSRLMTAVKRVTVGNVTVDDQRERHAAPRKIVSDKARLVREHFQQISTVSSHLESQEIYGVSSDHKDTLRPVPRVDGCREPWCGGC